MLVYRVEHKETRNGVYTSGGASMTSTMGSGCNYGRHPVYHNDTVLNNLVELYRIDVWGKCRFGFVSIQQLRRWFFNDVWIRELNGEHVISIYEVPDESVFVGITQLIFKNEYHTEKHRVETFPFVTLLDNPTTFDKFEI